MKDGKRVYMAVPKMASSKPFYLLDPKTLTISPEEAAEKKGVAQVATQVGVDEVQPIDIVVCGSVAVNRSGARIGKGAGYSDLEVTLLIAWCILPSPVRMKNAAERYAYELLQTAVVLAAEKAQPTPEGTQQA